MCRTTFLFLIALCLFAQVQAQVWPVIPSPSVINTAGGTINLTGEDFIEFSIGEMAVLSLNLGGNPVGFTQGFLQPRLETPYVINTQESFDTRYGFNYYPNPAANFITVETGYPGFSAVQFINLQGQIVQEATFDYAPIDCGLLPAGVYLVRLFSDNRPESKTFKLLKP